MVILCMMGGNYLPLCTLTVSTVYHSRINHDQLDCTCDYNLSSLARGSVVCAASRMKSPDCGTRFRRSRRLIDTGECRESKIS
jgi:hypothetical protein